MDEVKFADLNDVQDFFNRSHSTSASGTFSTEQIDIKDFIEWCNDPCNNTSGNCDVDNAYRLGQTVCVLDKLDSKVIGKIYNILKDAASPMTANTDLNSLSYREKTKKIKELLDNARSELLKYGPLRSKLEEQGELTKAREDDLPANAVFYCALKLRLKDCPDEQGYYHYQFDDSGNTIARVDPLKPFTDGAHGNLDQQWHVLISLLALLDIAHALSSEHHKYHCLYPYLISYDKGDLNEGKLQLKSSLSLNVIKGTDYTCEPMMTWVKNALVKPEDK